MAVSDQPPHEVVADWAQSIVLHAAARGHLSEKSRAALIEVLVAVPREQYENAMSLANLRGMGREKAEAEADDLQAENHHLREALWRVANKAGDLQTARQIARAALNAKDGDR